MSCSILEKLKAREFVLHVVWLPHIKNIRIIVKDHVLAIVVETKEIHKAGPKGKFLWNCKQRRLRKKFLWIQIIRTKNELCSKIS
jgi:hypothetical protein